MLPTIQNISLYLQLFFERLKKFMPYLVTVITVIDFTQIVDLFHFDLL